MATEQKTKQPAQAPRFETLGADPLLAAKEEKENVWHTLCAMGLVAVVVSFLGFLLESLFSVITMGFFDNRNMTLPFLFGYGLAMVALYIFFGIPRAPRLFGILIRPRRRWLGLLYYFVMVFLCVSVGEILLGSVVEAVCHLTWWDYSAIPLHMTKFTSVPTSTGFSLLIMLFMQLLYEPLYHRCLQMRTKALCPLAVVLLVLLAGDCLLSFVRMYRAQDFVVLWRIYL